MIKIKDSAAAFTNFAKFFANPRFDEYTNFAKFLQFSFQFTIYFLLFQPSEWSTELLLTPNNSAISVEFFP